MAAITNDRKLTGLKTTEIYSLRTPVARLPKSKGRQGPAPDEVPGRGPARLLLASGGDRQPSAFLGFRCTAPTRARSSRGPLPVCLCVCVFILSCLCVCLCRLSWWLSGKESTCQCRRHWSYPSVRKIPWRRKWHPTPVFLPGESHEQRSLAGYSPWCHKGVRHDLATENNNMSLHSNPFYKDTSDCI